MAERPTFPQHTEKNIVRVIGRSRESCPVQLSPAESITFYQALHRHVESFKPQQYFENDRRRVVTHSLHATNDIDTMEYASRVPSLTLLMKHEEALDSEAGRLAVLVGKYRESQPGYKIFNKYVLQKDEQGDTTEAYRMVRVIRKLTTIAINEESILEETLIHRTQSTFYEPLTLPDIITVEAQVRNMAGRVAMLQMRERP